MGTEERDSVLKETLLPPVIGAAAGGAGGAALGAAGGFGAGSIRESIMRSAKVGDKEALERVIQSMPSKLRPVLMGALLVGGPSALAGLVTGLGRGEGADPYASRTAGGIAGGIGGAGLGYLLRRKGAPISSLVKGLGATAIGAGAGAMTGLGVGSTRYSKAQKRLRTLLEEAKAERQQMIGGQA